MPVEEVRRLEETLIIYPGAKIPLDGEVFEGKCQVEAGPHYGRINAGQERPGGYGLWQDRSINEVPWRSR